MQIVEVDSSVIPEDFPVISHIARFFLMFKLKIFFFTYCSKRLNLQTKL